MIRAALPPRWSSRRRAPMDQLSLKTRRLLLWLVLSWSYYQVKSQPAVLSFPCLFSCLDLLVISSSAIVTRAQSNYIETISFGSLSMCVCVSVGSPPSSIQRSRDWPAARPPSETVPFNISSLFGPVYTKMVPKRLKSAQQENEPRRTAEFVSASEWRASGLSAIVFNDTGAVRREYLSLDIEAFPSKTP